MSKKKGTVVVIKEYRKKEVHVDTTNKEDAIEAVHTLIEAGELILDEMDIMDQEVYAEGEWEK